MDERLHLTGLSRDELTEFVGELGEPRYRADQIFRGLHQRRLREFEQFTDLPKALRENLKDSATVSTLAVESKFVSEDGTRRFLMKTHDGSPVETVFIPTENRDTICFSSQSGCPLKCDFCLTAQLGLLRNLTAGEIVEQIIIVLNDVYGVGSETPHGTNLVAMGAGEPFLNFEKLIKSLDIMSDEQGLFIVPGRLRRSMPSGLSREELLARLDPRTLVQARVEDLVADRLVRLEGGRYVLTPASARLIRFFLGLRVLGLRSAGG